MPPFVHKTPVRFADVDHAGIVYYPVFFHYFHLAFEELFRQRMGSRAYLELLDGDRVGFPAVTARCDFVAPLRFGDTAEIEMSVEKLGEKSVTFRYEIYRAADDDRPERQLAAEGANTVAVVDLEAFRAIAAPADLRALFADLQDLG